MAALSADDMRGLARDLRILLATNGTLTRILEIVADDEVFVQIVEQQKYCNPPESPECEDFAHGRFLRRRVLLCGRRSGLPLVGAETLIATDNLPSAITSDLMETNRPIGEVLLAARVETFKEDASAWNGKLPGWVGIAQGSSGRSTALTRRYRIIKRGVPVVIITEYFLRDSYSIASEEDKPVTGH